MKKFDEYKVKLDLFEGPLDLLLYLVNKSEVEVQDISIASITKQYLEYIDVMRDLNINIASEYLSMAATLLRLKANTLLPESEKEESEDGEIINREQLIEKLLEYKKFKEAAVSLKNFETEQIGTYSRGKNEEIDTSHVAEDVILGSITIFDLISAFKKVLGRVNREDGSKPYRVIEREDVKIDDRIELILGALEDHNEVAFEDLFMNDCRKIILIVTFMAILELVKMKKITFRQEEQFGSLFVKKHPHEKNKE